MLTDRPVAENTKNVVQISVNWRRSQKNFLSKESLTLCVTLETVTRCQTLSLKDSPGGFTFAQIGMDVDVIFILSPATVYLISSSWRWPKWFMIIIITWPYAVLQAAGLDGIVRPGTFRAVLNVLIPELDIVVKIQFWRIRFRRAQYILIQLLCLLSQCELWRVGDLYRLTTCQNSYWWQRARIKRDKETDR